MSQNEFSSLLCGVGGQGLVMLSNIIGTACAQSGIRIITGEQHGLSQRSGTISVHLRIGKDVRSPLIPIGSGDAIISLEALESLRYIEYLKNDGVVITNNRIMYPINETSDLIKDKSKQYFNFKDVESRLRQVTKNILFIDALEIARQSGNPLTENMVILGALSILEMFPVPRDELLIAIEKKVPSKAKEVNIKAFELGAKFAHERFCAQIPCRKL